MVSNSVSLAIVGAVFPEEKNLRIQQQLSVYVLEDFIVGDNSFVEFLSGSRSMVFLRFSITQHSTMEPAVLVNPSGLRPPSFTNYNHRYKPDLSEMR